MSGMLMSERFVAVFPSLVRALGSIESAAVLQHLNFGADDSGTVAMTYEQISDATGIGFDTVKRRVKHLRDEGIVTTSRASRFDSTLVYQIDYGHPSLRRSENRILEEGNLPFPEQGNLPFPSSSKKGKNPPTPQRGADEPDPFDLWWAHYPKKDSKIAARKAYAKAAKTAGHGPLLTALIAQQDWLTAEFERGYCPNPTTWLNQGRWEDKGWQAKVEPFLGAETEWDQIERYRG